MTISQQGARELCAEVDLEDQARAMLQDERGARQFIDALVEKQLYLDAIRVLARALPKLHAVQWACGCIRPELGGQPDEKEAACLTAAEQWVADPVEEKRLAAKAAAEASDYDTPGAWAATAAAWSGGSLGPPSAPAIPPPEHLTALAAAGAVALAAAKDPEQIGERQLAFLEQGLEFAERPDPITPEPIPAATGEDS